jgi:hypothetical protein
MEAPNPIPDEIFLSEIDNSLRIREDIGDLSSLKFSIKEYGLIQPLVVTWDENRWKLLVGGRRYYALQELGRDRLIHGKEILIREELYDSEDPKILLIRATIEMEENLKRKEMTWQEQAKGKAKLLELLQQIHGVRPSGGVTKDARTAGGIGSSKEDPTQTGFSMRKLASVLGESPANVSVDLQIAEAMRIVPSLEKMDSRAAALTKVKAILEQMRNKNAGIVPTAPVVSYRVLVHVANEVAQADLIKELEARGLKCEPVII